MPKLLGLRFAAPIFLGAFLLFLIQPLMGRYILPRFGGTPGIWNVCMLFFQVLLLLGYLYAHGIARKLPPKWQGAIHCGVLAVSLLWLPVVPSATAALEGDADPTFAILVLLVTTVGAPFLVLSATSPLLQYWSAAATDRSPYRLYALSNTGSLLALIAYPFALEATLPLRSQATFFSVGYALFVLACGIPAFLVFRAARKAPAPDTSHDESENSAPVDDAGAENAVPPSVRDYLFWLGAAAVGSVMLLATTNQLCQNVAVVPFLWVLPLTLYLLSFIITFDRHAWYRRDVWGGVFFVSALAVIFYYWIGHGSVLVQVIAYSTLLLSACMICHGEIVRARPAPRYLTAFYLVMACGGALGGIIVTLIAPYVFKEFWEFPAAIVATAVVLAWRLFRDPASRIAGGKPVAAWIGLTVAFWLVAAPLGLYIATRSSASLVQARNFFGVLSVVEQDEGTEFWRRSLLHGRVNHGSQYQDDAKRMHPTSYYNPEAGVGVALREHPGRSEEGRLHIGVIGLGAGVTAVYAEAGDRLRFYEINPEVVAIAEEYFTFLSDTPAEFEMVVGDGRIELERELAANDAQAFDVLVLDVFTGDAIPMHLLTDEAFGLYWEHLKPGGILVLNISNLYVELSPVVRAHAQSYGKKALWIPTDADAEAGFWASSWIVVTSNPAVLEAEAFASRAVPWEDDRTLRWTDDFSNLFRVLR